jgi:hypothetical protein
MKRSSIRTTPALKAQKQTRWGIACGAVSLRLKSGSTAHFRFFFGTRIRGRPLTMVQMHRESQCGVIERSDMEHTTGSLRAQSIGTTILPVSPSASHQMDTFCSVLLWTQW